MSSMGKRLRAIDWERTVVAAATVVVKYRRFALGFVLLLATIALVASLDPPRDRDARARQRLDLMREVRARDQAWHAEQAKMLPPTGKVALDFRELDFRLPPEADDPRERDHGYGQWVPPGIKAYDGRQVVIDGFMLPTRMEKGGVRECMILANRLACCYSQAPRFCGFIAAHIEGKPLAPQMDRPVTFEGTLHIGDVFTEGYWTALYTLDRASATRSMLAADGRFR